MAYRHQIQYYETDQMGVVHHSNYIRWMEEARIYYMGQVGLDYIKMEENSLISPVHNIECKYIKPSRFGESIDIYMKLEEFKGVKIKLYYEMKNLQDEIICIARSETCFVDKDMKPIRLKKDYPHIYDIMMKIKQ